jgi:hypothetical protein
MDCDHYFLSETAQLIWKTNDSSGEKKMYECMSSVHKESFFKRVVFQNNYVPYYRALDIAEGVFNIEWIKFNEKGRAGIIVLESLTYTGLFYIIFKRAYIRVIEREMKIAKHEISYKKSQPMTINEIDFDKNMMFSPQTQKALDAISANCKQMLIWKHIDGLSHDEIALEKNINRESSIKMVSRCGKQFLGFLENYSN